MLRLKMLVTTMALSLSPFAGAQAIDVMNTVFGVTTRTPYCSLHGGLFKPVFWLQDVFYTIAPNHQLILRYTTLDPSHLDFCDPELSACNPLKPTGNMSVYERVDGNLYVVSEYRIWSDSNGWPVSTRDIQQYNPRKLFSPRYVQANIGSTRTSTGTYSYCVVDADPGSPRVIPNRMPPIGATCTPTPEPNSSYRYELKLSQVSPGLVTVGENYWQNQTSNIPNYSRGFFYATSGDGRSLLHFTDNTTATTYQRFNSVDPISAGGACR